MELSETDNISIIIHDNNKIENNEKVIEENSNILHDINELIIQELEEENEKFVQENKYLKTKLSDLVCKNTRLFKKINQDSKHTKDILYKHNELIKKYNEIIKYYNNLNNKYEELRLNYNSLVQNINSDKYYLY